MTEKHTKDVTWLECGRIGRPVGLRGELAVAWLSGEEPVKAGDELFADDGSNGYRAYRVAALRKQGRSFILRLEGIDDRNGAEGVRGLKLFLPAGSLPKLPDGEYYSYEIMGLDVVTENGKTLGQVVKIFTAGQNDVYEVRDESGKEVFIPAIDSVVLLIDLDIGKIVVKLLDGM